MQSFRYTSALPRLFCGPTSLAQLGRELDRLQSSRAVVFCGASLARSGSPLDLVRSALGEKCAGVYPGVRAHSPLPDVLEATEELRRLNADAVIAVGGGSAVVTARAATILAAEQADIRTLCTSQDERGQMKSPRLTARKLPQLIVPTTPNTAAVKAGTAVHDPATGERLALFDPKTRAQAVFIHPQLLDSAPEELVVSASLDTFTLALEGLASLAGNPIADAMLMHAVRLLAARLAAPLGADPVARMELMLAAVLCGHGTDSTGAGIATVLGHAVGGRCGVENGIVKAIVMPHALQFNAEAARTGLQKMAVALGASQAAGEPLVTTVNNALRPILARLAPGRLRDIEVPRAELAAIAAHAMGDWFLRGNPHPVRSQSELQQVLEEAW